VSRSAGYEVVEFNASDQRSAKQVNEVFDRAAKFGTIGKRRVIIMDEVDGMNAGDRGGVTEIAKFCRIVSFPIICIANERTSPKLRPLASCCLDIRFSRPTKTTIAKSLVNSVVKTEKLRLSVADLERMCEESGNDIRSIVNSMQFSAQQEHQEAGKKDEMHRLDPFSATGRLFGQKGSLNDRMDCVYLDHNLVPLMVAEGYIQAADKGRGGDALERCVRAAEQISNWDMINTKIHTVQMWGLLPSATLAVVNASKSANGPAPFQIFPSWLGKNSKRLKHRRLVKELQTESGIKGEYGLCDTRNTLRTLLFNSELSSSQVVEKLHDLRMTRDNMLETLVETCFKDDEDSVKMDTKKKGAITREWKKTIPKFTTTIVAAESLTENDISDVNEIDESDDEDYIYS
jgi:replication factor C subunit 1